MSEVKAKPTPGVWRVPEKSFGDMHVVTDPLPGELYEQAIIGGCGCCGSPYGVDDSAQSNANLELICEAGTVHHETGMTPRELVARCKELREALQDEMANLTLEAKSCGHQFLCTCPGIKARAALAKHKEI